MPVILVLFEMANGFFLFNGVPESLALLASGVGLVGATVVLRRLFKRHDEKSEGDN